MVGLGVVSAGAATYFGLSAISLHKDWDGQATGVADEKIRSEGRRNALISDIAAGVAVVSIGVGAFLLLTKPKSGAAPQAGVFVAPSFAGVRGRF